MQGVVRFKFSSEPKPNRLIITLSISDSQNWFKYPEFKKLYVCHHSETVLWTIGNVTVPWSIIGSHELRWSARCRWLFCSNSAGSKETTTIRKTHPTLVTFICDRLLKFFDTKFVAYFQSYVSDVFGHTTLTRHSIWYWWASKYDFKSVFCYVRSTLVPS